MRILFVLEHYYPKLGGVETLFHFLAQSLVSDGHEVTVVTTEVDGAPKYETYQGVTIHRITTRSRVFFALAALPLVFRLSKEADIMQTSTFTGVLPTWIVHILRKKPAVLTVHEVWGQRWFGMPFLTKVQQICYWLSECFILTLGFNAIVAVSQATKHAYMQYTKHKMQPVVIYNGLPKEVYPKWQGTLHARRFLYIGRLGVSKGLDILLPAFLDARTRYPDLTLDIVMHEHQSPIAKWIHAYIAEYGLEKSVSFLPPCDRGELLQRYATYDALVIPSYAEGFGFVAVEGGLVGIPRVVAQVDSLPEVVSGLHVFVEPRSVHALAEGMCTAASGVYQDLPAKIFSMDESCGQYKELYSSLCPTPKYSM